MKRSVAITGPTPEFLRWAIGRPCDLRDLDDQRVPDSSFRQLRGIRELSLAIMDQRVVEGVAIHPEASPGNLATAKGFLVSEIAEPQGGIDRIQRNCASCQANICHPGRRTWAGCFGAVSTALDVEFDKLCRGMANRSSENPAVTQSAKLIGLIQQAAEMDGFLPKLESVFFTTRPCWYGLWMDGVIKQPERLQQLARLISRVLIRIRSSQDTSLMVADLSKLYQAISVCANSQLPLHVDLVPEGFSNGSTWTLKEHCSRCGRTRDRTSFRQACPVCGAQRAWQNEVKSKVLGIRPYVNLNAVLGAVKTARLVKQNDASSRS